MIEFQLAYAFVLLVRYVLPVGAFICVVLAIAYLTLGVKERNDERYKEN